MEEIFPRKESILSCVLCGSHYPLNDRFACECGGLLEVLHDFSFWKRKPGYLQAKFALRRMHRSDQSIVERRADRSLWRFRELLLPDLKLSEIITRGEGNSPLYGDFHRTMRWLGLPDVHFKHLGIGTPTGSFKDYGMTAGISWAKRRGTRMVACASTGNTSASVASYAAAANIPALILLPEGGTALGKIAQSLAYGAKTVMVRGDFDAALRLLRACREKFGLTVMNSVNPVRLEGQKAITLEVLEELGWQAPDWIVVPAGNLGNASAVHKALSEARDIGLISRMPRIAMVQAAGAAPFYRSRKAGWVRQVVHAETMATAIKIGDPVNYDKAKRAILDTDGIVVAVPDGAIADAKAMLDSDGVGAEPGACAAVAGLKRLVDTDVIASNHRVVVYLTGNVLKDPDATIRYHSGGTEPGASYLFANPPVKIDSTPEALEAVLAMLK